MKKPSAANIRGRIDALLPFSGAVTGGAKKLGHTDGALVGRALKLFSTSHPSDKGKRILTHVKTEAHGIWTPPGNMLGYAAAFSTHRGRG